MRVTERRICSSTLFLLSFFNPFAIFIAPSGSPLLLHGHIIPDTGRYQNIGYCKMYEIPI